MIRHGTTRLKTFAALLIIAAALCCAPGCGGGGGGGGGGGATPPPAGGDTTAPAITFDYPSSNAAFTLDAMPESVQLSYSDASGLDPSTLNVTLTVNSRTLNLTSLFGTSATQNATSSRTDVSDTNPLYRTVVSRFARTDTGFATTPETATVPRGTATTLPLSCLTSEGAAVLWSPGLTSLYTLPASGAFTATAVSLGFNPTVAAAASGTVYVGRSGFNQLFAVNATTGVVSAIITLPDEPAHLAYHSETGKLYISYKGAATFRISRLDTASGNIDQTLLMSYVPVLLETRRGDATEGVFAVGVSAGRFRLFAYDGGTVQIQSSDLGLTQPSDMAYSPSGYVYLSRFDQDSVTRVQLSDGAATDISVGRFPRALFPMGTTGVYAANSGDHSVSIIAGAAVSATTVFSVLPLSGLAGCGTSYTLVSEDVWDLSTQVTGTLTATIKDKAGNTGTASISLMFSPAPVVPLRVAGHP